MKYTIEQVLDGICGSTNGIENPVYEAWSDMATDWFQDVDPYLKDGFTGWNDRTIGEILCDFHYGGLLELTDEQIKICEANRWSAKTSRQVRLFKKVLGI